MINRHSSARPTVALVLALAVAAVACGEQQATLPIEPAGPRPATSTTTEPDPEMEPEVVVDVPTATPATTEPEAVPVAVPVEPSAETATGTTEEGTADAQSDVDGVVVMNTWLETTTTTAAPATTEAAPVTTTTEVPATTTTTAAPATTVAPTTTEAVTTTTTEVVTVTTIAVAPTTTTTTTAAPAATTTTTAGGGGVAPPIPRPGDPDVPEVNDARQRPVHVDLSWFPEMKNVISYEQWNRIDEANTPWWAQRDEGRCGRRWWSYPLTIQVGTVLANVPNGAYCDKPGVYSYVVTRMWHTPVCGDPDDTDNCIHNETPEANRGVEVWRIVLCGYTFEGSIADFGTSYRAEAMRQPDGRFRVVTNWLFTPSECNR